MALQADDTAAIDGFRKAQRRYHTHNSEGLGDNLDGQFLGLQPVGGDPVGTERDAAGDEHGDAEGDEFDAAQQVADGLGVVGATGEARHLAAEGGRHAHVKQAQPGLQQREQPDEAVGFDPEVLDVQRDESQAHQGRPALAEVVGDEVAFKQGRVRLVARPLEIENQQRGTRCRIWQTAGSAGSLV